MADRTVTPDETRSTMSWIVMPGQTNSLGTVFGGQVMAWIDVCAAVSAQRFSRMDVVTASMDYLIFRKPIQRGEVAIVESMVNWAGKTSMEVGVRVFAEDPKTGKRTKTSTAYLTFVALNDARKPSAVPPLLPQSEDEQRRFDQAIERRAQRLAARASSLGSP